MDGLIGGLIALLVWLLLVPVILLVVAFGLAIAVFGVALGVAAAVVGLAIHLFVSALPFLLIVGLIWLIFRPSSSRQIARQ